MVIMVTVIDKTFAERIGVELRVAMVRTGLSQKDLATEVGLSQPSLSRRLAGEVPWEAETLDATATRVGITITLGVTE